MLRAVTGMVTGDDTVEPTPTAVRSGGHDVGGVPEDVGADAGPGVEFSCGRGAPDGLHKHGHNVMLYKDDVPHVEVGVQVSGSFAPAGDALPRRRFRTGLLAATATHSGPIAKIGDTHQAVREWGKGERVPAGRPSRWEISYGDPDPSTGDFDVDVFWSLVAT